MALSDKTRKALITGLKWSGFGALISGALAGLYVLLGVGFSVAALILIAGTIWINGIPGAIVGFAAGVVYSLSEPIRARIRRTSR